MSAGSLVALLVILLAVLGLLGVVPFSPMVVFGMILGLALAVALGGWSIPWHPPASR